MTCRVLVLTPVLGRPIRGPIPVVLFDWLKSCVMAVRRDVAIPERTAAFTGVQVPSLESNFATFVEWNGP